MVKTADFGLPAFNPPFTMITLGSRGWRRGGAAFLKTLLVFGSANIAVGVNHSGDS
jgi:hypothetical protein